MKFGVVGYKYTKYKKHGSFSPEIYAGIACLFGLFVGYVVAKAVVKTEKIIETPVQSSHVQPLDFNETRIYDAIPPGHGDYYVTKLSLLTEQAEKKFTLFQYKTHWSTAYPRCDLELTVGNYSGTAEITSDIMTYSDIIYKVVTLSPMEYNLWFAATASVSSCLTVAAIFSYAFILEYLK